MNLTSPDRGARDCPSTLVRILRLVKLVLGIVATALGIARALGVI